MRWVAVYDTNILISALLSRGGNPFRCLLLARLGNVELVTCDQILHEFEEKLQHKLRFSTDRAREAAEQIRRCSRLVFVAGSLSGLTADPDDDKVLECAVVGGAGYLVTGDRRHLLPLGAYQGITILSAADFLAMVSKSGTEESV